MLPIATSDKSELYIGYATINGDMSGGFAPIADITKTKLFALADYLNKNRSQKNAIPQSILEKPPGAELKFDESKGRTINAEEDKATIDFSAENGTLDYKYEDTGIMTYSWDSSYESKFVKADSSSLGVHRLRIKMPSEGIKVHIEAVK